MKKYGAEFIGFAPIAIGLGLTLIHLISIPVTNTSSRIHDNRLQSVPFVSDPPSRILSIRSSPPQVPPGVGECGN